jgi:hypothetical protein
VSTVGSSITSRALLMKLVPNPSASSWWNGNTSSRTKRTSGSPLIPRPQTDQRKRSLGMAV